RVAVVGLHAVGVGTVATSLVATVRPVGDVADRVVHDPDAVAEEPQAVGVVARVLRVADGVVAERDVVALQLRAHVVGALGGEPLDNDVAGRDLDPAHGGRPAARVGDGRVVGAAGGDGQP